MSTVPVSNVFSDVYITGNCTVKGTITTLGSGTQWTTVASGIYYNSGNVGIGLTNPNSILNVNVTGSVANIYNTTTGSSASLFIVNTADNRRAFVGMDGTGLFSFSAGALAMGTDNTPVIIAPNYSTGEKMRITTTGLVGIGTNNPGSTLTVSGAGSFGSGYQTYTAPTGGLIVQGNVGIGTSNPGLNALQVSGNVVTSGFTSNATNTVFNFDTLTVPFLSATQISSGSTSAVQFSSNVDLGTGTMNAATVSCTTGLMFRNKLYNGNFQIWQRNTTFTGIGTNTYTADRWATPINAGAGSTLTVSRSTSVPSGAGFNYSIQIVTAATSGAPSLIEQRIEAVNVSDLVNGTYVTVSFWAIQTSPASFITLNTQILYPSTTDTWTAQNNAGSPSIVANTLTGSWAYYRATIQVNTALVATNGLSVQFWAAAITASTTILITGVQLEKGQAATPFEVRPYATDLALCQRYYQQWGPTSGGQRYGFACTNGTVCYLSLPYVVVMRAVPTTLALSSAADFNILGGATASSITLDSTSTTIGSLALNYAASQGSYLAKLVYTTSSTAYIGIGAEL
jgi:hypothetical protein